MFVRTLLDRYIFTELLTPFSISLSVLCFVMFTRELLLLVELLISKGVGLLAILKVFVHLFPSFLVLTLPISGIIASITAFGRLSYDNELVAMRAAGLSLLRLSRSVFIFSLLVFGLTLVLSQWGQPWANVNLNRIAMNLLRDQLILALDKGTFNELIPGTVIYVFDSKPLQKAKGIFISDQRNPREPRVIVAREYVILPDPKMNQLVLRLQEGVIHSKPERPDDYREVAFSTYDLKLTIDPNLYGGRNERPSLDSIMEQLQQSNWQDTTALRRLTEHYKDLAFPTASLVFCILGIPVGIVSKRSGRIGGFAVGVIVIIIYYVLNVLSDFLVTKLVFPPIVGAWLPNGIFLAITVVAFYRMNRH